MLPGKSYKSLCTFDRMTFIAHHVPAALLHICFDPSVRKITQLHRRALCKSVPPRRYCCGPPGTSDLQMRLGSTWRDFQWRENGNVSLWRCGKQWRFQKSIADMNQRKHFTDVLRVIWKLGLWLQSWPLSCSNLFIPFDRHRLVM